MQNLTEVYNQNRIIGLEGKKVKDARLSIRERLDWFADAYQMFEQRMEDTEPLYRKEHLTKMIELAEKIRRINQ